MKMRVDGYSHLVKDTNTGAVINTDTSALSAFKRARNEERSREERITSLEHKLERIEHLLEKLVNG